MEEIKVAPPAEPDTSKTTSVPNPFVASRAAAST